MRSEESVNKLLHELQKDLEQAQNQENTYHQMKNRIYDKIQQIKWVLEDKQ